MHRLLPRRSMNIVSLLVQYMPMSSWENDRSPVQQTVLGGEMVVACATEKSR